MEVEDSSPIEGIVELELADEHVVHERPDHDLLLSLIFFDSCYTFFKYEIEKEEFDLKWKWFFELVKCSIYKGIFVVVPCYTFLVKCSIDLKWKWKLFFELGSGQDNDKYTPLTKTPREIFVTEGANFPKPPPMRTPEDKRTGNGYCEYHVQKGHTPTSVSSYDN